MDNKKGILALSPLLLFIAVYLVSSMATSDFYAVPICVAFVIASIYAIAISGQTPLKERINQFSRGAGTEDIMLMIWIFVLAGAFATSAKSLGAVNATVDLMLTMLPDNMVLPGLFLATCFISLSIGTSVGTIVALVPIAAELATATGTEVALTTAIVVGGAFFGDNLSFISDTTIAATSSQGCSMKDKFRVNVFITVPAALVILMVYTFIGIDLSHTVRPEHIDIIKVLPYISVLATAIAGMNVMMVLTIGIGLTGVIGLVSGQMGVFEWMHAMGDGITSMGELIIVTMLAGGLFETVRHMGGIDFVIEKISTKVRGKRGGEAVIGLLVAVVDMCTANNTVAIISVGGIAKRISLKYDIDNRRAASLLDTCSCCMQGIIPYGAQMLMASGLTRLNPIEILPYLYYPMALMVAVTLSIITRYPKRYC